MFKKIFVKLLHSRQTPFKYNNIWLQNKRFCFTTINKDDGKQEILAALRKIPFENGKNLVDSNYIVDMKIKEDGSVEILLKLDQNYRKIKSLCLTELNSVPWIKNLAINMAPKVLIGVFFGDFKYYIGSRSKIC